MRKAQRKIDTYFIWLKQADNLDQMLDALHVVQKCLEQNKTKTKHIQKEISRRLSLGARAAADYIYLLKVLGAILEETTGLISMSEFGRDLLKRPKEAYSRIREKLAGYGPFVWFIKYILMKGEIDGDEAVGIIGLGPPNRTEHSIEIRRRRRDVFRSWAHKLGLVSVDRRSGKVVGNKGAIRNFLKNTSHLNMYTEYTALYNPQAEELYKTKGWRIGVRRAVLVSLVQKYGEVDRAALKHTLESVIDYSKSTFSFDDDVLSLRSCGILDVDGNSISKQIATVGARSFGRYVMVARKYYGLYKQLFKKADRLLQRVRVIRWGVSPTTLPIVENEATLEFNVQNINPVKAKVGVNCSLEDVRLKPKSVTIPAGTKSHRFEVKIYFRSPPQTVSSNVWLRSSGFLLEPSKVDVGIVPISYIELLISQPQILEKYYEYVNKNIDQVAFNLPEMETNLKSLGSISRELAGRIESELLPKREISKTLIDCKSSISEGRIDLFASAYSDLVSKAGQNREWRGRLEEIGNAFQRKIIEMAKSRILIEHITESRMFSQVNIIPALSMFLVPRKAIKFLSYLSTARTDAAYKFMETIQGFWGEGLPDQALVLIIDGLGYVQAKIFEKYLQLSNFEYRLLPCISTFPSTTAPGHASLIVGSYPREHGIVDFKSRLASLPIMELLKQIAILHGTFPTALSKLPISKPAFPKVRTYPDQLKHYFSSCQDVEEPIVFLRVSLDGELASEDESEVLRGGGHLQGPYHDTVRTRYQNIVEAATDFLPSNSLLIMTSDHGMMPVYDTVQTIKGKDMMKLGRTVMTNRDVEADDYLRYRKDELIALGMPEDIPSFAYTPSFGKTLDTSSYAKRGDHGGLTPEEMLVPLIMIKKKGEL